MIEVVKCGAINFSVIEVVCSEVIFFFGVMMMEVILYIEVSVSG